jgi:hypothetical protein
MPQIIYPFIKSMSFLSIENFKNNVNIFETFLRDQYSTTSQDLGLNLRQNIYMIMENLVKNPEHIRLKLTELNEITLRTMKDIMKKKFKLPAPPPPVVAKKENRLNEGFSQADFLERIDKNQSITSDFEKVSKERYTNFTSEEPTKLQVIQEEENPLTNEEFQEHLKVLQERREKEQTDIIEGMQDGSSLMAMNDPKLLYIENENRNKEDHNTAAAVPSQLSTPIIQNVDSTTKEVFKDIYISINSIDRDWIKDTKRYQYKVNFQFNEKETKQYEIYENNPTIPYTKSTLSDGISNISGYYDESGSFHEPYDSTSDFGNVIGYENVEVLTDTSTNVQRNLKNIYSISINNVVIPIDNPSSRSSLQKNSYNFNYPYLLLQIDEFTNVYDGTNETTRKSFCKLLYKTTYSSDNGRGYVILKVSQFEKKVFEPVLLSTMPSLHFSILTPYGQLVNDSRDGYSILKIEYEPFNRYYLKVITNSYFDKNEFYTGDHIIIKLHMIYKLVDTANYTYIQAFNTFINKPEGHRITNVGTPNDSGYFKSFYIQAPGFFSESTGTYVIDNNIIEEIITYNCNTDFTMDNPNGYILNTSLQNSISMTVVTKDLASKALFSASSLI